MDETVFSFFLLFLKQCRCRENVRHHGLRRGVQTSHSHLTHRSLGHTTRYGGILQQGLVLGWTLCSWGWWGSWHCQMYGPVWWTLKCLRIALGEDNSNRMKQNNSIVIECKRYDKYIINVTRSLVQEINF